jgi:hypothetical protein
MVRLDDREVSPMLLIVIILLVAYILVPLLDLCLKEQPLFIAKLLVYILALAFILYELFAGTGHIPWHA